MKIKQTIEKVVQEEVEVDIVALQAPKFKIGDIVRLIQPCAGGGKYSPWIRNGTFNVIAVRQDPRFCIYMETNTDTVYSINWNYKLLDSKGYAIFIHESELELIK